MADPVGAKELIDDASRAAGPQARSCIDAFLTVYWAAMGKPHAAIESSEKFTWEELPDLVAQRVTAWARALAFGEAGRAGEAAAAAKAGYPVPIRCLSSSPTPTSAPDLWLAISTTRMHRETIRQRQIEFQAFQSFQVGLSAMGRVALGSGRLEAAISTLTQCIETVNASTASNGWGYRCQIRSLQRSRCAALPMRRRPGSEHSKSCATPAG